MPTAVLFRDDAYLQDCAATIVGRTPEGGILLDRTVFYAAGGGQPGDRGELRTEEGVALPTASAAYADADKTEVAHVPADTGGIALADGERVTAAIDWPLRYARMRMHTALHLLSAVLPYPVTGGAVGDGEGR